MDLKGAGGHQFRHPQHRNLHQRRYRRGRRSSQVSIPLSHYRGLLALGFGKIALDFVLRPPVAGLPVAIQSQKILLTLYCTGPSNLSRSNSATRRMPTSGSDLSTLSRPSLNMPKLLPPSSHTLSNFCLRSLRLSVIRWSQSRMLQMLLLWPSSRL